MKLQKVFRSLVVQASVLAMLLIGLCAIPSSSYMIDTMPKIENVSLPGAYGTTNNTAFFLDRYSIVAPFGPSTNIEDVTSLSQLDNNRIYLFDTKKPESTPKIGNLNNCYFPTKLVFDAGSNTVFVRGTEYVEVEPGSGLFESHEILAHIRLNLDGDKPGFDPDGAVTIRIKGKNSDVTEDAPDQFVLGHGGNILVFTNGSLIFTYDVLKGDFYPVVIDNINPGNVVSYIGIEETSNTLIVATSRRVEGKDGVVSFTSDLYFYQLVKDGTVNLIKHLGPEAFGEGIFLTAESNAVVSLDPNTGAVESGYFMTNDGAVCVVDLKNKDAAVIERVTVMPEFAQSGVVEPGPVSVKYDRAKKLLTVVKRGGFTKIRRPSFVERGGKIRRPSFVEFEGSGVVGLVQFSKKNRVVGQRVFDKVFGKESRISNLVAGQGAVGLIATYSGLIFTVDSSVSLDRASVSFIGEIGSRIDHIAYNTSRQSLIAISSYKLDDENQTMLPGSVLFAKIPLNSE